MSQIIWIDLERVCAYNEFFVVSLTPGMIIDEVLSVALIGINSDSLTFILQKRGEIFEKLTEELEHANIWLLPRNNNPFVHIVFDRG